MVQRGLCVAVAAAVVWWTLTGYAEAVVYVCPDEPTWWGTIFWGCF